MTSSVAASATTPSSTSSAKAVAKRDHPLFKALLEKYDTR